MAREKKSFEKSLNELEEIVEKLEQGDMPLDESIKIFQRGVALSKELSKMLDEIEKKITILVESENGDIIEEDFIKD
ncbi:MAG TPA: exodeoxyribonuclease VII small subunit [Acetivibrio clariflavus]|nr:exodeoxyribonuclease VII small subunit [Acetivibrio clariflavus]HPU41998.1 exodeoxyribonuclease VII small subunit [Acetivibrio clariflavus]